MTELKETNKNNPKTQKDREVVVDKYSKESYRSQSQIGQNASIQRTTFVEAIKIMGETIDGLDEGN